MRQLLTTEEVAKALSIGQSTVTWRARNGKIPVAQQLSGRGTYLFDPEEIEKLAAAERAGNGGGGDK